MQKAYALSEPTAARLKTLLAGATDFAPGGAGKGAHSQFAFVLCTDDTAAGEEGVNATVYPGEILRCLADIDAPVVQGDCWLTVLGEDGEPTTPALGAVYPCLIAGRHAQTPPEGSEVVDTLPRAFGADPTVGFVGESPEVYLGVVDGTGVDVTDPEGGGPVGIEDATAGVTPWTVAADQPVFAFKRWLRPGGLQWWILPAGGADASGGADFPGYVTSVAQTWAGIKTFLAKIASALGIGGEKAGTTNPTRTYSYSLTTTGLEVADDDGREVSIAVPDLGSGFDAPQVSVTDGAGSITMTVGGVYLTPSFSGRSVGSLSGGAVGGPAGGIHFVGESYLNSDPESTDPTGFPEGGFLLVNTPNVVWAGSTHKFDTDGVLMQAGTFANPLGHLILDGSDMGPLPIDGSLLDWPPEDGAILVWHINEEGTVGGWSTEMPSVAELDGGTF